MCTQNNNVYSVGPQVGAYATNFNFDNILANANGPVNRHPAGCCGSAMVMDGVGTGAPKPNEQTETHLLTALTVADFLFVFSLPLSSAALT